MRFGVWGLGFGVWGLGFAEETGAPSKAMLWMLLKSGYLSRLPSFFRIATTSLTVSVP
jgi:hypothetical protein